MTIDSEIPTGTPTKFYDQHLQPLQIGDVLSVAEPTVQYVDAYLAKRNGKYVLCAVDDGRVICNASCAAGYGLVRRGESNDS